MVSMPITGAGWAGAPCTGSQTSPSGSKAHPWNSLCLLSVPLLSAHGGAERRNLFC